MANILTTRKRPIQPPQDIKSTPADVIELSDDDELNVPGPQASPSRSSSLPAPPSSPHHGVKRKRSKQPAPLPSIKEEDHEPIIISDSEDSDEDARKPPTKLPRNGPVSITRQCTVDKIIHLTKLPEFCWTVPRPGERVAYLLDLSGDSRDWKNADGSDMSMAAIIRSQVSNRCFRCRVSNESSMISGPRCMEQGLWRLTGQACPCRGPRRCYVPVCRAYVLRYIPLRVSRQCTPLGTTLRAQLRAATEDHCS